jgi:succinyl-diaminopimelate desuccinylase
MAALDTSASLTELTMAICDIESVSGNEAELANAIEAALANLPHLSVVRDANAILASTNTGKDRVLIAGHIDTVPVAGNLPTELHHFEREQVVFGRGTVDMKAGVAVMLKLAVELTEPTVDVTWIFYDNEEVDSALNGLGRISRNRPELLQGKFAVLCEPTSAMVEGGCNGTIRAEVRARGIKAHSARPWMGKNAIHELLPALQLLSDYEPAVVNVDGLDYKESLNAVMANAGIATNVIPDVATLMVNYRFAPDKSSSDAEVLLRDWFKDFEVEIVDAADGARPGLNTEVAQSFIRATGSSVNPKYGWTDVARFSSLGIPAVNYGPGDPALAHADNENVPVGHIHDCYLGLKGWLTS